MKKTRFLLPAEIELFEAAAHYETQVNGLGEIFLGKVESAVQDISNQPESWQIVYGKVRRRLVHRFPYAVLYRNDPEEIAIIAVMHQRRRPNYWIDRV